MSSYTQVHSDCMFSCSHLTVCWRADLTPRHNITTSTAKLNIPLIMSCSQRTLPGTIDAIAIDFPTQTWARFSESQQALEQGRLVSVSFADLSNAINRLAWFIDDILPQRNDLETIAYVGPSDIRHYILACAASKCRLKVGREDVSRWM